MKRREFPISTVLVFVMIGAAIYLALRGLPVRMRPSPEPEPRSAGESHEQTAPARSTESIVRRDEKLVAPEDIRLDDPVTENLEQPPPVPLRDDAEVPLDFLHDKRRAWAGASFEHDQSIEFDGIAWVVELPLEGMNLDDECGHPIHSTFRIERGLLSVVFEMRTSDFTCDPIVLGSDMAFVKSGVTWLAPASTKLAAERARQSITPQTVSLFSTWTTDAPVRDLIEIALQPEEVIESEGLTIYLKHSELWALRDLLVRSGAVP